MAVAAKKRSSSSSNAKNSVAAARGKKKSSATAAARGGNAASSGATWEFLKSVAWMLLIFVFVRAFLVEAFRIPSGSMIPTLLVGDWLFVNKLVYGPHVPFTNVNLPGYGEPRRGEVVVFQSPTQIDQPEDPTPTLVKRLIGMPGDTIYMRQGMVYVNGIAQRQGYAAAANPVGDPDETNELFAWQRDFSLVNTRFGSAPAVPTHDNWGPLLIPAAHYMMLGDNRYNSKDSRYWGFVPRVNVRGRPIFVYYSYDTEAGLPWLRGVTEVRWSRIGHTIR